jgi:flagellar basal body-associated protein FliL
MGKTDTKIINFLIFVFVFVFSLVYNGIVFLFTSFSHKDANPLLL